MLSNLFQEAILKIGMEELERPVFQNAPIGIRFEIGGTESTYIENETRERMVNPSLY